jgi:DNA-binding MarR family transcriptional regulator
MRRHMRGNRGGLSIPQFRALVRVEREPSATITAIAEHLSAPLSTTSRLVTGLVGRKFLARETAPVDRRQARVSITGKGAAVLRSARDATARELDAVFQEIDSDEQDLLIQAMRILRQLFGSRAEPRLINHSGGNGRSHGGMHSGNRGTGHAAKPPRVVRV